MLGFVALFQIAFADAGGAATNAATRTTTDLTGVVLTCPNENVVFSGVESVVAFDALSPSGQHTLRTIFELRGVTATGQQSGTRYRVTGVTVTGSTFAIGSLATASTSHFVQTWRLVPVTGGQPLSFQEVLTVVYDASGSLVAVVSSTPGACD